MTTAILVPSRGRPEQFKRMVESANRTAGGKIKIYSGSNGGDDYVDLQFPIDCPTVYMWNELAADAMRDPENDIFMLGSDDIIFSTPLWDLELKSGKPWVYHLQDSRDQDGTPHPIVTREWIEALGFFMPPIFMHWMIDIWTVNIAKHAECYTHLTNYLLVHEKPSDRGMGDETHNRIRRNGWRERDNSVSNACSETLAKVYITQVIAKQLGNKVLTIKLKDAA